MVKDGWEEIGIPQGYSKTMEKQHVIYGNHKQLGDIGN
jgi:hypothetical protein